MRWRAASSLTFAAAAILTAQTNKPAMLRRTVEEAEAFRTKAPAAVTQETLRQRSFIVPPHSHFAIGPAAADPLRPRYFLHEILSEYAIGPMKGSSPPQLIELREPVTKDGAVVSTPA